MERSNEGDDTDTSRDEEHWNHDDAKPSTGKGGDETEDTFSDWRPMNPRWTSDTAYADLSRNQTPALRIAQIQIVAQRRPPNPQTE